MAERLHKLANESEKTAYEMELTSIQETLKLTTKQKQEALRVKETLSRQVIVQFDEIKLYTAQQEEQKERIKQLSALLNEKTAEQRVLVSQTTELEGMARFYQEDAYAAQQEAYAVKSFNTWCCKFDQQAKTAGSILQRRLSMFLRW
jgi:transposase